MFSVDKYALQFYILLFCKSDIGLVRTIFVPSSYHVRSISTAIETNKERIWCEVGMTEYLQIDLSEISLVIRIAYGWFKRQAC